MGLIERIVVPVANERDAKATAMALSPYVDAIQQITLLHVIEKGGGVIDKAPMEKRQADADGFLSIIESRLEGEAVVETRIEFGTHIAETIVETAYDIAATAIVFRPRGGSRLRRLLSGDTAVRLLTDPEFPVIALPTADDSRSARKHRPRRDGPEVSG